MATKRDIIRQKIWSLIGELTMEVYAYQPNPAEYRWVSEFFGPDKIPDHAITSGNQYPNIYDVVRYVEWQNATGSLFDDDTATSCMSYYGLCE